MRRKSFLAMSTTPHLFSLVVSVTANKSEHCEGVTWISSLLSRAHDTQYDFVLT